MHVLLHGFGVFMFVMLQSDYTRDFKKSSGKTHSVSCFLSFIAFGEKGNDDCTNSFLTFTWVLSLIFT